MNTIAMSWTCNLLLFLPGFLLIGGFLAAVIIFIVKLRARKWLKVLLGFLALPLLLVVYYYSLVLLLPLKPFANAPLASRIYPCWLMNAKNCTARKDCRPGIRLEREGPVCHNRASDTVKTGVGKTLDPVFIKSFGQKCQLAETCGDLAKIDCGASYDGPLYYVRVSTREIVSKCGGWCYTPEAASTGLCADTVCPPAEWTCSEDSCEAISFRAKELLEFSNHCFKDADCEIRNFGCPFGCESYLNKNAGQTREIERLVKKYGENCPVCQYGCYTPEGRTVVCRQGKCVEARDENN